MITLCLVCAVIGAPPPLPKASKDKVVSEWEWQDNNQPQWHVTLYSNGSLYTRSLAYSKITYAGTWSLQGDTLTLTEVADYHNTLIYNTRFRVVGKQAFCPYSGKVLMRKR